MWGGELWNWRQGIRESPQHADKPPGEIFFSSDHIREKDGLWSVLAWLSIMAARKQGVEEIVREHWARFGRNYFCRFDYEGLDPRAAFYLMRDLETVISDKAFSTQKFAVGDNVYSVERAENFEYIDPVDGTVARNQ
ncbi:Phosphoglucomutase-5, partial [Ataeniobius toweri]|nr:Phosphoglucomutase-5 [Ataeniobius toweri]